MAVAVWAGQTSSGGPAGVGGCETATGERRIAVVKGTAKKAVATLGPQGSQGSRGPWQNGMNISQGYP